MAGERDRAGGVSEPEQRPDQRRLAGPVGPEQADDFSSLEAGGDCVERPPTPVVPGDAAHVDTVEVGGRSGVET
jgi:hypothetical protein